MCLREAGRTTWIEPAYLRFLSGRIRGKINPFPANASEVIVISNDFMKGLTYFLP